MDSLARRIDVLVERLRIRDTLGTRNPNRSSGNADVALTRELVDARRHYEALLDRAALAVSSDTVGAQTDARAIRQVLAPDEALLEYLSTPEKLVLFVSTRDQLRWFEASSGSVALAEQVRLAQDLIGGKKAAVEAPLRDLYDKLIAPAKAAGLLNGIRSLVIVPHAALTYLPFAALRSPARNGRSRYLVEDYATTTIASASALPLLRQRGGTKADQSAVVFAPLPASLPSTQEEAAAVGRNVVHSRVVLGSAAAEPALRDALQRSGIVHVATHGILNPDSPMFSGIDLYSPRDTTARRPDNDGRLETHEVLSMNVRSWLVFLSGCETALGYSWSNAYSRRDDYATLAQAFLFAGARNVVATLWRIEDRGAAEFADRFYTTLGASSPALALAGAQRSFIADARYSAPYYWAGYVLSGSGEDRP